MEDRVKRFLSGADWKSLWAPRPAKPASLRPSIRHIQQEEARKQPSPGLSTPLSPTSARLKAVEDHKAKLRAFHQRLLVLATPKRQRSRESEEDWPVGPADYDTRLELGRASYLSNRPKCPSFTICKIAVRSTRGKGAGGIVQRPSPTPSPTPFPAVSHRIPLRSHSIPRARKPSLSQSPRKASVDWKTSLRHVPGLCDPRDYTPSPPRSYKGLYSIPKSGKRFNIRKCKLHIDSEVNQRFNELFRQL